ncbi:MAG: rhodanese-like domain-containing protein [Saprospiraceae bacterium]|nr:rhodanese-like domain-containing protein [Saprospiraceae bacterium]
MDPEFHEKVRRTISGAVPTMDAAELKEKLQNLRIFDAREREEYEVSHIPGAEYIGYKNFDIKSLANIPKDTPIVLYCSIGYRSEKIGEKLLAKGFTNVFNLYGSIFEWVNRGYPVVNFSGEEVKKVHTYNKEWSRWVDENQAQKIW